MASDTKTSTPKVQSTYTATSPVMTSLSAESNFTSVSAFLIKRPNDKEQPYQFSPVVSDPTDAAVLTVSVHPQTAELTAVLTNYNVKHYDNLETVSAVIIKDQKGQFHLVSPGQQTV